MNSGSQLKEMGNNTLHARVYPNNYRETLMMEETTLIVDEFGEVDETELIIEVDSGGLQYIKTNIIDRLPQDLVIKIYKEYLEPEVYYTLYKNIIESRESIALNGTELVEFLPRLLAKPVACKYISEKCFAFNNSFQGHKIKNKKSFKLMRKGQSFAATILFNLYH